MYCLFVNKNSRLTLNMYLLFNFLLIIKFAISLNLKNCRVSLGMQSGEIPDDALTASGSFDVNTVGPKYSRIRTEANGGAWCPKSQIETNSYEYLEINLRNLTVITSVETQGRFGNGLGQEYTENYILEYQREDDKSWMRYKNRRGEMIINGNSNTYIAEMREIVPPILAKRIRFVPYSKLKKTVCLRVELYGCSFQEGIVSYQIPQGDKRNDVDLIDNSYDGVIENNILKDGLGQLTDGELGEDDYRAETHYFGVKGYEWVGWKRNKINEKQQITTNIYKSIQNQSINHQQSSALNDYIPTIQAISPLNPSGFLLSTSFADVPLIFKFDYLRNFSSVLIHCNNMFSKDVQLFHKVVVQFSLSNNTRFQYRTQLIFDIPSDLRNESARFIKLDLANHIARTIRLKLYFQSKWVLISEVSFNSNIINDDPSLFTLNLPTDKTTTTTTTTTSTSTQASSTSTLTLLTIPKLFQSTFIKSTSTIAAVIASAQSTSTIASVSSINQYYLLILIISILILLSIFALIVIIVFLNKQKYKSKTLKLENIVHQKSPYNDSLYTTMQLNLSPKLNGLLQRQLAEQTTKLLITPLNNLNEGLRLNKNENAFSTATTSLSSSSSTSDPSTNQTNTLLHAYYPIQLANDGTLFDNNQNREYCNPDMITATLLRNSISNNNNNTKILSKNEIVIPFINEINECTTLINETSPYASVDITEEGQNNSEFELIQGICGNTTCYMLNKNEFMKLPSLNENMKRLEDIKILSLISDGQFGKIFTVSINSNELDTSNNSNNNTNKLFIAKILSNSSNDTNLLNAAQQTLFEEIALYSRINHPNLANMIGYGDNPYCLLHEYKTEHGHLDEFIRQNNCSINYSSQLFILMQISSAMKYLERLNLVHRDLALRNCLVYNLDTIDSLNESTLSMIDKKNIIKFQIKLTDIAICMPQHRKDYYLHHNSTLLPIRHMPAEALFEGIYSSSSDVWSFGILIWQLFTNCLYTPFTEWSNHEYLQNLKIIAYSKGLAVYSLSNNRPISTNLISSSSSQQPLVSSCLSTNNFLETKKLIGLKTSPSLHKSFINTNNTQHTLNIKLNSNNNGYNTTAVAIPQQQNLINEYNHLNFASNLVNSCLKDDTFIKYCLNMTIPFNCTKEIHDLLIECCNTNIAKRPKFNDIYLFLQCKLFGSKA